jgi:hypothetical protein
MGILQSIQDDDFVALYLADFEGKNGLVRAPTRLEFTGLVSRLK